MPYSKWLLLVLFVAGSILTLTLGDMPWEQVWQSAAERLQGKTNEWNPLLDERLPRLLVILSTGAALAVSGTVMQALFHNPLASPSVLGTSCGGSLFVSIVFVLGWQYDHPYAIPIAAFSGCLLTLLLVYALSKWMGGASVQNLILTGIAISTLLVAIQSSIIYALRDQWQLIQSLTEWQAGSTFDRSWKHVHMQLPLTLIGLAGCWHYRHEVDLLALGDEEAKNLGVDVSTVRWRLFLCVALLTGGAIAAVGVLAFFGLVLPHMIRKISGPENARLIPLCITVGACVLTALDLLLRFFDIHTLSIGNVTAVLGGIFFLMILLGSQKKEWQHA